MKRLPWTAAAILALAGCATPMTTREKGAVTGAAVGAGTGALIGSATGHTATGALIGGAAGAVAGGLIGDQLQAQEQRAQQQAHAGPPPATAPPPPPSPQVVVRTVYSEYYRVQPVVIERIGRRGIHDDDAATVLFLAQRAQVSPDLIVDWRLGGASWMAITLRLGLQPDIYYVAVPATTRVGPPYGKAYGYWRKRERERVVLTDADVVNLVHLRIVSEYYGYPAETVMKWREDGQSFQDIVVREHGKHKGKGRGEHHPGKGRWARED